jgi:catechol 2,3-dioxygenase-like lactoylglutathione lyase family enzyme
MMARLLQAQPVLAARSVPDSVRFFQRLGFAPIHFDDPTQPRYAALVRDGVELHLQWADESQWTHPGDRPAYRFRVDDVDVLYREFHGTGGISPEASAGSPWAAPADTTWGTREFHLRDPAQNSLQFYQLCTD